MGELTRFYSGFRRGAHPMAVMVGVVGALSAFYHDSIDEKLRKRTIDSLRQVLEAAGLEFTDGRKPGVRLGK